MFKKTLIGAFLLVCGILLSGLAYAGTNGFGSSATSQFDVSIDRVSLNGQALSQSKNNLVNDADVFSLVVDITAVKTLDKGHIEASLRGRQTNDAVAASTPVFDLISNRSATQTLTLTLTDGLTRENDFELVVKIIDAKGRSEQKTYGVKTKQTTGLRLGELGVSIDRVRVNSQAVAASRTTFIEEKDEFKILVDLTALENLVNARVEAVLEDRNSGNAVAGATSNFNLADNANTQKEINLTLIDSLKRSNDFELTIMVVDSEGDSLSQVYGLTMRDGILDSKKLDVSFDKVEVENVAVVENRENFVVAGEGITKLDVDVSFTSLESIEHARLEAILMLGSGDVVADVTQSTFDISPDQKISKSLDLELPGKFKQDSFKLVVRLADAEGNLIERDYGLKIIQQRFPFVISLISLDPDEKVQPGKSLGVKVMFRNSNVVPLDGLFARASINSLGVSSTKYINPLKNEGKDIISEEFIIRIPKTARPGIYTLTAEIGSQIETIRETREIQFEIAGKAEPLAEEPKTSVRAPIIKQDMLNDGTEAAYSIIVTNNDAKPNSYTLLLNGNEWADLRLNEASAFVLEAKQSKTLYVYASTTKELAGEQVFFAAVKSNEKILREVAFKANVIYVASSYNIGGFKPVLQVFLILAVLALAGVGVYYGMQSIARKEESNEVDEGKIESPVEKMPDASRGEAYY